MRKEIKCISDIKYVIFIWAYSSLLSGLSSDFMSVVYVSDKYAHPPETESSSARAVKNRVLTDQREKVLRMLSNGSMISYGKKVNMTVAVEWQHVAFLKGKVNMAALQFCCCFFMQRVHCGCIYRSKGYQVFVTCVCVIMGCVWIIVCIWLSTCCLIVSS